MLLLGTREFAQSARKKGQLHNGMQYWRNDFFKSSDDDVCTPQCYLVEQFPGAVNPTHFHVQNQFQLFTRGEGTIGRSPKPLRAFTVLALEIGWRRIGENKPGQYSGLREAVEKAMSSVLSLEVKPVDAETRKAYAEACRAIAWAGVAKG